MNEKYRLRKSIFGNCISLYIGQDHHSKQMRVYCVIKKNYLNTNVYISMLRLQIGSRQTSDGQVGEYIE